MAKFTIPSVFTAVDKFSGPVDKMGKTAETSFARVERKVNRIGRSAFNVAKKSALIGAAIVVPLVAAGNQAVKFEDQLADVGKTTGLQGEKLKGFGDELLNLSKNTRTSIEDLATIGEIGGQLGIAEDQLISFVKSADDFNIALGKDFGSVDEAVAQVGKIKALFADTKDLEIADVINRVGSSINQLGAIGAGTSANITDFTLRIGALPDAFKPSVQEAIALGTALEEVGVNAQIGASGLTRVLITAGTEIGGFANQMGITTKEAKALLAEDPTKFVSQFASTFKGLAPEVLAGKLKSLKLNSNEVIKVIGALGSQQERLTTLVDESNKSFSEATSLQEEAATKNATSAAKMAILKNQVQAVAIKLGNALLPIMVKISDAVTPIIDKFSAWVQKNPALVSTIAKVATVAVGLFGAITAVSFVVGVLSKAFKLARIGLVAYNIVLGVTAAITGKMPITMGRSKVALVAYSVATKIATVAQKAMNLVMNLTPWGIALTAALAVGGAVTALSFAFSSQTTAQKLNNEVQNRALDIAADQITNVKIHFAKLRILKAGTDEYASVLKKVEAIQPGITAQFKLQTGELEAQNAAEKALTASIIERAKQQARTELAQEKIKESIKIQQEGPGFFESIFSTNAQALVAQRAMLLEQEAETLIKQNVADQPEQEPINIPAAQQAATNETIKKEQQTLKIEPTADFAKFFKLTPEGGATGISLPSSSGTN